MVFSDFIDITADYETYNKVLNIIGKENITVISTDFKDDIVIHIVCPIENTETIIDKISEASSGKVKIEKLKRDYYGYW